MRQQQCGTLEAGQGGEPEEIIYQFEILETGQRGEVGENTRQVVNYFKISSNDAQMQYLIYRYYPNAAQYDFLFSGKYSKFNSSAYHSQLCVAVRDLRFSADTTAEKDIHLAVYRALNQYGNIQMISADKRRFNLVPMGLFTTSILLEATEDDPLDERHLLQVPSSNCVML